MSDNFYWVLDIVTFTLLHAEYFCVPINILKLYPETQLSFLETVLFLQVLLLICNSQDQSNIQFRGNYSPLPRQDFSAYST